MTVEDGAIEIGAQPMHHLETHAQVAVVGPVGVGKTFLAHVLGAAACRRGYSVTAEDRSS